jgi:archaemetzincin
MSSSRRPSRRKALLAALAAASVPSSWTRSARAGGRSGIVLQPLGGGVPSAELALVRRALEAVFAEPVLVLPDVPLPKAAFYAPRSRYRAEKLLDTLRPRLPPGALRIAGITAVDISTTKPPYDDWGILGLANIDGSACVLSTFRCHRRAKSAEHARVRFAKTAVHELGHTFGLEHCPNRGCLMEDGGGSVLTTDRERDLCLDCRALVAGRGILRSPPGALPW